VSAGELVDAAGLKGRRIGGAVVSEKHANFIVNDQGGTATDVRRLAELVKEEVARVHGIELVLEVSFVGDWGAG
jgi:UDP-N-acetylmuramate dehydrogenase